MNAVEIEQAVCELCARPFDAEMFPFQFLEAFGEKATTIKRLRSGSTNQSDLHGGVLQRNNIHMLVTEKGQAGPDLRRLIESPTTAKHKAKFALATDGEWVEAENLAEGETLACALSELPDHFGFFLSLAGIATVKQIRDNAFDIKATARMNRLYVELQRINPDWDTEERRADLNHFFARLIFCFFAEDTGIFPQAKGGLFTGAVQKMSDSDGSNTHEVIGQIFRAMNVDDRDRAGAGLPRYACAMPYVNGGLFDGSSACPRFSKIARSYLIHIGGLNWTKINPDIFGSMIQAVAEDEERGELGMHYTSVPNILRVLGPLFLDDLRLQLEEAGESKRKLHNLRTRMARIRVFDPACGSGNFLVVAYKEMRAIEAEINRRRGESDRASEIPLTNFRGIELRSFAAEVARLALVIARFQCDLEYRGPRLALSHTLPLSRSNWITCGNALRLDWAELCPPTESRSRIAAADLFGEPLKQAEIDYENEGGETYLCGNPPYAGSSKQTPGQKQEVRDALGPAGVRYKNLDYVACWFYLASVYCRSSPAAAAAFVATNSICQGEQVGLLWPHVLTKGVEISFAHTSFKWSNLAKNNAGVICVVVGLSARSPQIKYIYSEGSRVQAKHINAYLIDFRDIYIPRHSESIASLPRMIMGNKPTDGGHLLLSLEEKFAIERNDSRSSEFIYPLYGSDEFINGKVRFCLWIEDEDAERAAEIAPVRSRVDAVAEFRSKSRASSTRAKAANPHRFIQVQGCGSRSIAVPEVSSERREYLPCGLLGDSSIATNKLFTIFSSDLSVLAICVSRLHLVWIAATCGRMKTDYSYSNVLGYNSYPLPSLSKGARRELADAASRILLARESYWPATLAALYDPDRMDAEFPRLREAHEHNDTVLEGIYIGRRFKNDTERLERLFEMYAAAVEPELTS